MIKNLLFFLSVGFFLNNSASDQEFIQSIEDMHGPSTAAIGLGKVATTFATVFTASSAITAFASGEPKYMPLGLAATGTTAYLLWKNPMKKLQKEYIRDLKNLRRVPQEKSTQLVKDLKKEVRTLDALGTLLFLSAAAKLQPTTPETKTALVFGTSFLTLGLCATCPKLYKYYSRYEWGNGR